MEKILTTLGEVILCIDDLGVKIDDEFESGNMVLVLTESDESEFYWNIIYCTESTYITFTEDKVNDPEFLQVWMPKAIKQAVTKAIKLCSDCELDLEALLVLAEDYQEAYNHLEDNSEEDFSEC